MDQRKQIDSLRAVAHPIRLRILSLLTAEAMSAADVARELEITHANASYHLRQLHQVGELVIESEEKVRGGLAKRYRYNTAHAVSERASGTEDRLAYTRATAHEVERRILQAAVGSGNSSDLEAWVPIETWRRALELVHEASLLLHAEAQPSDTPETVHISFTVHAFTMTGGLTGKDAIWEPKEQTR